MRDFEIVGAFHEAGGAKFMVPMRGGKTVEATHEPYPIIPSFFPRGGEGAWRAVEGNSDWFMARFTSEFWRRSLP
ncbi:MAG: hypothetical protein DME19_03940 [Verrucomicrobia bacterium]|nr:MAG: hypothetical protein DME19_03940 [Verrucomicrobiota bacterium]